jgi:hypothetical protein
MEVLIHDGTVTASFANGQLSSVSGTIHAKSTLERRFGDIIKKRRFRSGKEAESMAIKHLSQKLAKKPDVKVTSRLALDLYNDKLAYLIDANEYRVFIDAETGKPYHDETKRSEWWWKLWYNEDKAKVRSFNLPANRAYFVKNGQKRDFEDGAVDRNRRFLPWRCHFRTSYGAAKGTTHLISRFPFPSTYLYRSDGNHGVLVRTGSCWENNALTADSGADFWVQNTHYRISTAARYAARNWSMHLFADWTPEQAWPLHVELHYQDGTGGGAYIPHGATQESTIVLGRSDNPEFDACGWLGRFLPIHEYSHYITHMYKFLPGGTCQREAVKEGLADALAVSFAAKHDPTFVTAETFKTPISGAGARPWWLTPTAENQLRQISAPCTNYYDSGLAIAQLVYKFLNNRICISFDQTGCVAQEMISTPSGCSVCHKGETPVQALGITREAVRDAMTYAMNVISPSDATVELVLKTMYRYIETYYWNVIQAPEDRQRVRLAFTQHGVDL